MPEQSQQDWHAAWVDALDDLELEVDRAVTLLHHSVPHPALVAAPWVPPQLPPIPPDLVERARLLHARQLQLAERLARRMHELSRQSALAGRIDTGRGPSRPLLLDRAC